jgi:methylmalonyl-CoA mutase
MSASDDGTALASGFGPADPAAWEALVAKALKGASTDSLKSRTADGIVIEPLHRGPVPDRGRPGAFPFWRGAAVAGNAAGGWDIRQRHDHPDPQSANRAILDDLEQGVRSIALRLDTAWAQGEAEPDGVMAYDQAGLARVLDGVMLDIAPVRLEAPGRGVEVAEAYLALLRERGTAPGTVRGDLGLDPIGAVALGRTAPEAALEPVLALVHAAISGWPGLGLLHVDAELYHAAGASEALELAAAIATGIAYLRAADAAGLEPALVAPRLGFTLAADADLFLTIAKFRAARRLWAEVTASCGIPDVAMRLEARSASRMLTRRDPHVNMLRGTAACFAAAIGGAEAITVLPFDAAAGEGSRLGRRIARNVQLVLMEESQLHRVVDPAGGSHHVEALSEALALKAWPMVQAIEGEGGMLAALRQGLVQDAIAERYMARLSAVAHRRLPITGVSSFPDLDEAPLVQEMVALPCLMAEAEVVLGSRQRPAGITAMLHPTRDAEGYERLRDLSDVALAEDGARPRLFVVGLGPLARHAEELAMVQNAFAAGGIETVIAPLGVAAGAIGAALAAAGTDIVCVCGIDRTRPEGAGEVVRALLAAGAIAVYAAGRPDPALTALGIDGFVHDGVNLVGLLEDVQSLSMGEAA